ncbi:MAG: hypothetical protein M0R48_07270 [Candidatus Omnitrophica bacterium]|jgi:hypothetical protein|nr:hypothetical protein [Candidatus Omnitrophota bacterium]
MSTWRDLFHTLANKQNLISIGTKATKEALEDCLKKDVSKELKEKILDNAANGKYFSLSLSAQYFRKRKTCFCGFQAIRLKQGITLTRAGNF